MPTPAPLADENASPEPEVLSLDDSKSAFRKTYALMKDDLKWRLCSGRRVEDVVFNACCIMADEDFAVSPAQSFVLNVTTDETAKGWFEDDEWAEICESDLKLPDADPMFVDSMKRFLKVCPGGIASWRLVTGRSYRRQTSSRTSLIPPTTASLIRNTLPTHAGTAAGPILSCALCMSCTAVRR